MLYNCFQKCTYSFEVSKHITQTITSMIGPPSSYKYEKIISSMILHLHIKIVDENIFYIFMSSIILHLHIKIANETFFYKFISSMILHLHIKIVNEKNSIDLLVL
jgi:hypothetical protein